MAYALVPDGYKLQKVTKDQKLAVDKQASNEAVQSFFDGPASGELVKTVAIVVTPIVLAVLAKRGIDFAKDETEGILEATVAGLGGVVSEDNIKKLAEIIFQSSLGPQI